MKNAQAIHYFFMAFAIFLEVAANIFIKKSNGFKNTGFGAIGIISILASFTALSQATKGIDLSVAYALWGGIGIMLTAVAGLIFFKEQLSRFGWSGVAAIALGVLVLKTA